MRASFALAAALLACPAAGAPSARAAGAREWSSQDGGPAEAGTAVAADEAAWKALWAARGRAAPPADFRTQAAAAVFLGERPTGGWGVEWAGAARRGEDLAVFYRPRRPRGLVTQAFTRPWAVRLFPRPKGLLLVEEKPAR